LFRLAALSPSPPRRAPAAAPVKLQYTGYLVDSPVLDARVEVARDAEGGPYRMNLSTGLIGALGDMVPFHFKASSLGQDEEVGLQPSSYHSETSIYDNRQSISLSYGPDGSVTLTDDPPTEAGQDAVAQGGLTGTVDPLSAALAIIVKVSGQGAAPASSGSSTGPGATICRCRRLPRVSPPRDCRWPQGQGDGLRCSRGSHLGLPPIRHQCRHVSHHGTLLAGPGIVGAAPVLLRLEAESGLGKMHFDLRAVLP
jgi:hypothetical protein